MGDIKSYLRSIRLGPYAPDGETDPFIAYQDKKISKGRLLEIIEAAVEELLELKAPCHICGLSGGEHLKICSRKG